MSTMSGSRCRLVLLIGVALALLLSQAGSLVASGGSPRPTPTPVSTPSAGDVVPQGVGGKFPDLTVQSIEVSPEQPLKMQQAVVQVTIRNQGEVGVAAGNNFFVDLYVDPQAPPERGCPDSAGASGDYSWGVQGEWMGAGVSRVLTTTLLFTDTRTYDLHVQIDTDCAVVETDEYNNIAGPVKVWVRTAECFRQDSHPDFQYGFSNLDISHPDGMVYLRGAYSVTEPIDSVGGVPTLEHRPDAMVNDLVYTPAYGGDQVTDSARQEAPVMVNGAGDNLYVVWQDGRNGELYNRDVYFAYSSDAGGTWSEDIRVNQDSVLSVANQGAPDLVYDESGATLYAVWHDNRAGDYDIYLARSINGGQTWQEAGGNPVNDDLSGADQLSPSLAVEDGVLYLAWQDERNGHSHIYFSRSMDGGENWDRNVFVSDDPESQEITEQWQTAPALAVYDRIVYIAWEDEYGDDPSDIYYVWGKLCDDPACDTICFDVPIRVNNDGLGALQRQPVMAAHLAVASVRRTETIPDPENPTEIIEVECYDAYEGTALHFAWQDFRAGPTDPDIYYAWAFDLDFDFAYGIDLGLPIPRCISHPGVDNPFGLDREILGNKKVNSEAEALEQPADDGCYHPQDEGWGEYQGSLWQEHPAMLVKEGGVYGLYGVYIGWSDGWVFDDYWNHDLWLLSTHRSDVESGEYLLGEERVVNDNVKLYGYLNADQYSTYGPAQSRQTHPTLASCPGIPCIAWDDNRRGDPLAGGVCNHDIFFARPRATVTDGVYLSPIFDAESTDATWYVMDWWATTPYCGRLTFQTRLGNTPWPDEGWSQWTGAVQWNGDWVYDAPGQHIVDETQNPYPQARYIQYKARLSTYCGSGGSPQLRSVTLYHNHTILKSLLPVIWRTSGE